MVGPDTIVWPARDQFWQNCSLLGLTRKPRGQGRKLPVVTAPKPIEVGPSWVCCPFCPTRSTPHFWWLVVHWQEVYTGARTWYLQLSDQHCAFSISLFTRGRFTWFPSSNDACFLPSDPFRSMAAAVRMCIGSHANVNTRSHVHVRGNLGTKREWCTTFLWDGLLASSSYWKSRWPWPMWPAPKGSRRYDACGR